MDRRAGQRLTLFLVLVFGLTLVGVLVQRRDDAILAVEAWSAQIEAAAAEAGLPDPFLLAGLVYAESRGEAQAVSSTGALGLCQLLPSTAAELAARYAVSGPPYAPQDNLRLGARYLRELMDQFDGDEDLGLLAYRLGPGAVRRAIAAAGSVEAWKEEIRVQKPSPWEWRKQIERTREQFRRRAHAGLGWGSASS